MVVRLGGNTPAAVSIGGSSGIRSSSYSSPAKASTPAPSIPSASNFFNTPVSTKASVPTPTPKVSVPTVSSFFNTSAPAPAKIVTPTPAPAKPVTFSALNIVTTNGLKADTPSNVGTQAAVKSGAIQLAPVPTPVATPVPTALSSVFSALNIVPVSSLKAVVPSNVGTQAAINSGAIQLAPAPVQAPVVPSALSNVFPALNIAPTSGLTAELPTPTPASLSKLATSLGLDLSEADFVKPNVSSVSPTVPKIITTVPIKANANGQISVLDAADAVARALSPNGLVTTDGLFEAMSLLSGLKSSNGMIDAKIVAGLNSKIKVQSVGDIISGITGGKSVSEVMQSGDNSANLSKPSTSERANNQGSSVAAINAALAKSSSGKSSSGIKSSSGSSSSSSSKSSSLKLDISKSYIANGIVTPGSKLTQADLNTGKFSIATAAQVQASKPSESQSSAASKVTSKLNFDTTSKSMSTPSGLVKVQLTSENAPVYVDKTIYNALKQTGWSDSQMAGALGSGKMGIVQEGNKITIAYKTTRPDAVMSDSGLFTAAPYKTVTNDAGAKVNIPEWSAKKLASLGLNDKAIANLGQETVNKINALDIGGAPKENSGALNTILANAGSLLQIPDIRAADSGLFSIKPAKMVDPGLGDPIGHADYLAKQAWLKMMPSDLQGGYTVEPTVTGILEMNKVANDLKTSGKSLSDVPNVGGLTQYEVLKNTLEYADSGTLNEIAKSNPRLILGAATDKVVQPLLETRLGSDLYQKTLNNAMTDVEKQYIKRLTSDPTAKRDYSTALTFLPTSDLSKDLNIYSQAQIAATGVSVAGPMTPSAGVNAILLPLMAATGTTLKVVGKAGEVFDLARAIDGSIDVYEGSKLIGKAGAVAGDSTKLRVVTTDNRIVDITTKSDGKTLEATIVKDAGAVKSSTDSSLASKMEALSKDLKYDANTKPFSSENIPTKVIEFNTVKNEGNAEAFSAKAAVDIGTVEKSTSGKAATMVEKIVSDSSKSSITEKTLEFKSADTAASSGKKILESKLASDGKTVINKTEFEFTDANGRVQKGQQFEIKNPDGSTTVSDASSFEQAERDISAHNATVSQAVIDQEKGLVAMRNADGTFNVTDEFQSTYKVEANSGKEAIENAVAGKGTPVTKSAVSEAQDFTPKLDELTEEWQAERGMGEDGGGSSGGDYGGSGSGVGSGASSVDYTKPTYSKDWGTNIKYEGGIWKFEDPKNPGTWLKQSDYEALVAKRAAEEAAKVSSTPTYNSDWKTNVKLDTDGKTWLFEDVEHPGTYYKQTEYENLLASRADARSPKYNQELGTYTITDKNGVVTYLDQSTGYYVSKADYDAIVAKKAADLKTYNDAVAAANQAASQPQSVVVSQPSTIASTVSTTPIYDNPTVASNTLSSAASISDEMVSKITDLASLDDETLLTRNAGVFDDPVVLAEHSADLYALAAKKSAMGAAKDEISNLLTAARKAVNDSKKLLEAC